MPGSMQLFVKRLVRDESFVAGMEREIQSFLADLSNKIDMLQTKYREAA